jgi:molybdopterin converting factor subunit 1
MKAVVKFFAALQDLTGSREVEIELADGTTIDQLCRDLCARYPRLGDYSDSLMYSVNAEYVRPDHTLRDGDEVALIPPVSGGGGAH